MQKNTLKLIAAIATMLMSVCLPSTAQMLSGNEPERPSTSAWEFIRYGEISPSLYTGTVNLSIPFATYEDPDFVVPLSFNYSSNGCIPNDRAGNMGVGWNLEFGGMITREIKGSPDDYIHNIEVAGPTTPNIYGFRYVSENNMTFSENDLYVGARPDIPGSQICYYYDGITGKFYDAEPDIFHFNFMGYTGKFMFGFGNQVYVYDTNVSPDTFRIETDFAYNTVKSAIAIVTSDGYRYEFDGYSGNQTVNTETFYYWGTLIMTWRLSRIVAPNGRIAEFGYQIGADIYSPRPNSVCYSLVSNSGYPEDIGSASIYNVEKAIGIGEIRNTNPVSLKIDTQEVMSLSYESTTEYCYTTANELDTQSTTRLGAGRLVSVEMKYGGDVVKKCTLTYDDNNKAKRNYLKTITVDGEGTYTMEYYDVSSLPMYGTFKIDHWGYFNNRSGNSFLKVSTLSANNLDETLSTSSTRVPNAQYAMCGMLSKIVYPTGGWSSLSYEANSYARTVVRKSASDFAPVLESASGIAGGVRIKSIEDFDKDGTSLFSRQYQYQVGTGSQSSGILSYVPRYQVYFSTGIGSYSTYGTIWSNNLTRYSSTHIEYSEVMEVRTDGSAIRYSFTTSADCPDVLEYDDIVAQRTQGLQGVGNSWTSIGVVQNLFMNTSRQYRRGRLVAKEYLKKNVTSLSLVGSESTTWSAVRSSPEYRYNPQYLLYSVGIVGTAMSYYDMGSVSESRIYGSNTVARTVGYTYNSALLRSSASEVDSRGDTHITRWKYISDCSTEAAGTALRKMYDLGQVSRPLEEAVYVKKGTAAESLVHRRRFSYVQPDATNHPSLFCVGSVTDTDGSTGKTSVSTMTYDKTGRLLTYTSPAGICTVYVWGYGGLYPVASVVGATLAQVKAVSGLSGISNAPLSGALPEAAATALRALSGAETTVWEYSPLIGLTKETSPDGRSVSYTYNATGKLHEILDDLGRKTGTYLYSTDNKR